eukprot:scaffold48_cov311-Pinguiococcus_pyrenoidosus.AAC.11
MACSASLCTAAGDSGNRPAAAEGLPATSHIEAAATERKMARENIVGGALERPRSSGAHLCARLYKRGFEAAERPTSR